MGILNFRQCLLPPPRWSARLLVRLPAAQVGMFRFLLEAHDNAAYFTAMDAKAACLKVVFSPQEEARVRRILDDIATSLPLTLLPWPSDAPPQKPAQSLPHAQPSADADATAAPATPATETTPCPPPCA